MTNDLERAHLTLCRGAAFFAKSLRPGDSGAGSTLPITHRLRSKLIGNGLRELDRFLNILIDEAARQQRLPMIPRLRNTARKLQRLLSMTELSSDDFEQLLALATSRKCLFHLDGIAGRVDGDESEMMTLGWCDGKGGLRRVSVGSAIVVESADLESIRQFYVRLANDLLLAAVRRSQAPQDRLPRTRS